MVAIPKGSPSEFLRALWPTSQGIPSANILKILPLYILRWPELKDLLPEHLFQTLVGYRFWIGESVIQACADLEICGEDLRLGRIYSSPDSPLFDPRWLQHSDKAALVPCLEITGLCTSGDLAEIIQTDSVGRWSEPISQEEFVQKLIQEAERVALYDNINPSRF